MQKSGISLDLVTWVQDRVRSVAGREVFFRDTHALRQLSHPDVCRREITVVHHAQRGVTGVLLGNKPRSLGVAVDMGTTTLAAYLCDLQSGRVLASAASVNPQRRFGEDVISRIAYANERESGLALLQSLLIEAINYLIERCVGEVGASMEDIDELIAVGNTTMERTFIAFHPHSLGIAPYMPVIRPSVDFKAIELGLSLNPGTNVHLFPVISGFVGGDTLAAIVAEKPHEKDEVCLIIDIGTNGEVVLGNRNGLWATSCATGPAFEGANISCGMRAVSGAICKVDIDPDALQVDYEVLGESAVVRPIGVCGSGVIDALASLRKAGMIAGSGSFEKDRPGVVYDAQGIGRGFVLVPAERSGTERDITLTLKDVREIQLAKSALSVGIEFLMRSAGVARVDRTVLTGAFGAKFDWRKAAAIGMLPQAALTGEVVSVENLAGVGAVMALLDKERRVEAVELSGQVKFLELALDPDFAKRFAESTAFPPIESA
jgi:uncharacterized 2Fe-2S/4Fe-4S cluster protein (DUF4445 family)